MSTIKSIKEIEAIADEMRRDCIEMGYAAGEQGAHFGPALGSVDLLAALYFGVMNHDPKNPSWEGRDRLVLSCGHICPVLYASMAESGWKVKNTFVLATVLAIGSYIAFVVVLKLQFPVWPAFITG